MPAVAHTLLITPIRTNSTAKMEVYNLWELGKLKQKKLKR